MSIDHRYTCKFLFHLGTNIIFESQSQANKYMYLFACDWLLKITFVPWSNIWSEMVNIRTLLLEIAEYNKTVIKGAITIDVQRFCLCL